jgi:serine protease Do
MRRYLATVTALAIAFGGAAAVRGAEGPGQHTPRVSLGVLVEPTQQGAAHEGALVRQVAPDSAAARAGLRKGDIITRADSHEVDDPEDLVNALSDHKPGDRLPVRVWRDGQEKTLTVTLEERRTANYPRADDEESEGRNVPRQPRTDESGQEATGSANTRQRAFLGVEAVPANELTDRLRQRLGISADEGVVVIQVMPDSPAARAGLRHGDVIRSVNGKEIDSPRDLRERVTKIGPGKEVTLDVQRGDQTKHLHARLEQSPVEFYGTGGEEGAPTDEGRAAPNEENRRVEQLQRRLERLEQRVRELEQQGKKPRD